MRVPIVIILMFCIGLMLGSILTLRDVGGRTTQQVEKDPVVVENPATGFSCIQYPPEGPTRGRIVIRF